MILGAIAKLPFLGSPALQKNVKMLNTAYEKIEEMYDLFNHFTRNDWIYETRALLELEGRMNEEERLEF
jgi:hypothetical protein